MTTWSHLWGLPGANAWLLLGTLLSGLVFLWTGLGALRTSWQRYPPRWGRTRAELERGRKAWWSAALLLTMAVWHGYRIDVLWWLDSPVSDRALAVEVLRVVVAVGFAWAWRPNRHGAE